MAVMSTVHIAGMTADAYDPSAQHLGPLVRQQPGFYAHAAYPDGDGFTIIELWESEDAARAWYDGTVRPATESAGLSGFEAKFTELHNLVTP